MRRFAIVGAAALLGLLGIGAAARGADTKTFTAALSAVEETPPGPEGATGNAIINITMPDTLCYELTWSKETGEPNAGHIHKGRKGLAGPAVVNFQLPDNPKDCLKVDGKVLSEISADPAGFYVNLHTSRYPAGAIRGQLQAAG